MKKLLGILIVVLSLSSCQRKTYIVFKSPMSADTILIGTGLVVEGYPNSTPTLRIDTTYLRKYFKK